MALTHPSTTNHDEPRAVTVAADPGAAQRAAETNAAIVLLVSLLALAGGTQLLAALLGHFA